MSRLTRCYKFKLCLFLPASCFVKCVCSVHVRGPHFTTPVLPCILYCRVCAVCKYVDPIFTCILFCHVCVQCARSWTPFHHPSFNLQLVLSCVCSVHICGPRFTTPVFTCILFCRVCAVCMYLDPVSPPPFLPASCVVVCVQCACTWTPFHYPCFCLHLV